MHHVTACQTMSQFSKSKTKSWFFQFKAKALDKCVTKVWIWNVSNCGGIKKGISIKFYFQLWQKEGTDKYALSNWKGTFRKDVFPHHSMADSEILMMKMPFLFSARTAYPRQTCSHCSGLGSPTADSFPSRGEQLCLPAPGANLINWCLLLLCFQLSVRSRLMDTEDDGNRDSAIENSGAGFTFSALKAPMQNGSELFSYGKKGKKKKNPFV